MKNYSYFKNKKQSEIATVHLRTTCNLIFSYFQSTCLIKFSIHCLFLAVLPLGGSVVSRSLLTVKLSFMAWLQDGLTKVSLFVYTPFTHAPSSANATPEFEGRGGEELGVELSNTLYKVFNNKHSVDLKGLCISAGEHCWVLYVDVLVSLNRQFPVCYLLEIQLFQLHHLNQCMAF